MGDIPNTSQSLGDSSNPSTIARSNESKSSDSTMYYDHDSRSHGGVQHQAMPSGYANQHSFSHPMTPPGRPNAFDMNSMGQALSDFSYQHYAPPAHGFGGAAPLQYQLPNQQYGAPSMVNHHGHGIPYHMQHSQQYQGAYPVGLNQGASNIGSGVNMNNQYYQGQAFMAQAQQSSAPIYMQPAQHRGQSQVYPSGPSMGSTIPRGGYTGEMRAGSENLGGSPSHGPSAQLNSLATSSAVPSTVVRGPPRKPRQSGHAIWIGNLPPHTDLMSLVHHVCKETVGLESLFLISKSNCAFANFKDEAACAAAQVKIHDSKFQSVRLVSRLRRNSSGSARATPTGPAAMSAPAGPASATISPGDSEPELQETDGEAISVAKQEDSVARDKFFVVKSLTVEDLELSVRNGIWATQSHNEDALNEAYKTAGNVYLIFSANKSGEYFGYAKMISPINDDPSAAIEFAPKAHNLENPELPKAIPTSATEFTPNGRIIDDSARGTIFWEAESDESVDVEADDGEETRSDEGTEASKKAWGKPFKIEWISTTRLPFYRTRGLRNPWNSNREVKIARDGTELETNVGQRLIGLFHVAPSPVNQAQPGGVVMPGFAPMRNFQQ